MKKLIYISYFLLILLSQSMLAQTYKENNQTLAQLSFLNSSQATAAFTPSNVSSNNSIFIQQIGNFNNVVANTKSTLSNVNLSQGGNNNNIFVDVASPLITENVLQLGNNNTFIDLSRGSRLHSTSVVQGGNNQKFIQIGSNSISEKLNITMLGNNKTIIIRNFKR